MTKEKQLATKQIADLVKEIDAKLALAVKISEKYGIDFRFKGPSYGMGGHYVPKPENPDEDWNESDSGWMASSESCY